MRVTFVTANFPPEACGGTEQVVAALARELRARGVEVSVISGSDQLHDGVDVVREAHDGVAVARLPRRAEEHDRHGFVRPRLLDLVRDELETAKPDIVHVHAFSAIGLGLGALCRELGVPMVCTFHDLWVTCARFFRVPAGGVTCPTGAARDACVTCIDAGLNAGRDFVARSLSERDRLVRGELEGAAACLAPSRTAASFVQRCVPYDGHVEVVPHGLLRAVPAGHRVAGPDASRPLRVGTFGGLVPEKGLRELVEAVYTLPCDLHLAGPFHDEGFAAELRDLARSQCTYLHERGRYREGDRHPARDLDLAVFPSKCQETYGLVVDEALAHGVPVVCSDAGALAERDATPGVVVTPMDRLASVLEDLIGSADRLAALRAAIPAALPTIARSAERHHDLYRSLA
ncbi:MAG: glycosyltransferase [Planctomycetota bacterium]|nr:glycosyltransferase [Planctomycetota bacterium]MEC9048102.1 glycosyltransferase [Planctomycetota bacterium]